MYCNRTTFSYQSLDDLMTFSEDVSNHNYTEYSYDTFNWTMILWYCKQLQLYGTHLSYFELDNGFLVPYDKLVKRLLGYIILH